MAGSQTTEPQTSEPQPYKVGHKNEKLGKVVSAKMQKTIVVEVTRRVQHPVYKRTISKRKRFYAHDEQSAAKVGDMVRIIECRPISKLKRWRLGDIVRKAVQVAVEPGNVDLDTKVNVPGVIKPKGRRTKS
jgi:small subunit ribosomal protein S17